MADNMAIMTATHHILTPEDHDPNMEKAAFKDPDRPPQFNAAACSSHQAQASGNEAGADDDDGTAIAYSPGYVTPMEYEFHHTHYGSDAGSNTYAGSVGGDEGREDHLRVERHDRAAERWELSHDAIARLLLSQYSRQGILSDPADDDAYHGLNGSGFLSPSSLTVELSSGSHSTTSSGILSGRTSSPSLFEHMGAGLIPEGSAFTALGPIILTADRHYPRHLSIDSHEPGNEGSCWM